MTDGEASLSKILAFYLYQFVPSTYYYLVNPISSYWAEHYLHPHKAGNIRQSNRSASTYTAVILMDVEQHVDKTSALSGNYREALIEQGYCAVYIQDCFPVSSK